MQFVGMLVQWASRYSDSHIFFFFFLGGRVQIHFEQIDTQQAKRLRQMLDTFIQNTILGYHSQHHNKIYAINQ